MFIFKFCVFIAVAVTYWEHGFKDHKIPVFLLELDLYFQGQTFVILFYLRVALTNTTIEVMYLSSNRAIANVVNRDLDLHFYGDIL